LSDSRHYHKVLDRVSHLLHELNAETQGRLKRILKVLDSDPRDPQAWERLVAFVTSLELSSHTVDRSHPNTSQLEETHERNWGQEYYANYYSTLAQVSGIPEKVLTRYVMGHILPTALGTQNMLGTLERILRFEVEIGRRIRAVDELGYFDNTRLISDTRLLERAVTHALNAFTGIRITRVLTAAVDGIPLASLLAHRLDVGLAIAKQSREVGVREFIEAVYIPRKTALMLSLYVPRDAVKKDDRVLIVDDVIDNGETQIALTRIVEKAKAHVVGIFSLIAIGEEGPRRLQVEAKCPIEVVLNIETRNVIKPVPTPPAVNEKIRSLQTKEVSTPRMLEPIIAKKISYSINALNNERDNLQHVLGELRSHCRAKEKTMRAKRTRTSERGALQREYAHAKRALTVALRCDLTLRHVVNGVENVLGSGDIASIAPLITALQSVKMQLEGLLGDVPSELDRTLEELFAVVAHLDAEATELSADLNVIETLRQIENDAELEVDREFPETSSTVRRPRSFEKPHESTMFEYYRDARGFWRTIPHRGRRYPKGRTRANA